MTLEQLQPDTLTEELQIRRQELQQVLAKKLRSLKTAPEGRLRVAQAHEGRKLQYDMHPKKVTVLKMTGVELVTLFNLRFSCNTAYSFYCNRLSDRIYFSVPERL